MKAERQNYLAEADYISQEIAAIERLSDPNIMNAAYEILEGEFTRPGDWAAFIDAALLIRKDFGVYRSIGKEALQLSRQISVASLNLARLIRSLRATGVGLPVALRPDPSHWASTHGPPEQRELQTRQFINHFIAGRERDGGPNPPDIRDLLIEISEQCADYRPDFMDQTIESAVSSRQNSRKSAVLRAFATSLKANKIKLTAPVVKAMAIAANAVLNDPDEGISEDHVRKALASMQRLRKTVRRPSSTAPKRKTQATKPF